ncbi:osmotically activated L-carnitine/choline ABC transporter, permease protein OpuCB [Geomicrobium sp. JCM 19037]|nr:osmotically activated L-carnitine/choline ABC transporter, permease protein OpuCB [Geomicrobium sp. JCM 19037]
MTIAGLAVLFGACVAIPTAIILSRLQHVKVLQTITFTIANIFQTIPTIALLALLLPLFGIGMRPAIFALFLYSLLPLLRNTYAGIQSVDEHVVTAAKGMGFNTFQRLYKIELPIAFPYIMSGIRLTTVYIISWTTLAALIGAGGLGDFIVSGIGINNTYLIVTGAIAAIILALITDLILGKLENRTYKKSKAINEN